MQPYVHKKYFTVSCKCRECSWNHRPRYSKYLKVAARRLAKQEIEEMMYDYRQEVARRFVRPPLKLNIFESGIKSIVVEFWDGNCIESESFDCKDIPEVIAKVTSLLVDRFSDVPRPGIEPDSTVLQTVAE